MTLVVKCIEHCILWMTHSVYVSCMSMCGVNIRQLISVSDMFGC